MEIKMNFKHINFADYGYFPALRTRQAEVKGLAQLTPERKNKIIPLLTLGRWPRADKLETSVEKVIEALEGRPFFLDLTV